MGAPGRVIEGGWWVVCGPDLLRSSFPRESRPHDDPDSTTHIRTHTCTHIHCVSAGQPQVVSGLLPRLVPLLLELAAYRPRPAVREAALQCLLLLLDLLPYTALHPYRPRVARALAAAVDDPRRSVRRQAARCRQAWGVA